MQFCNYSTWLTPDEIYIKVFILLFPTIVGIILFLILACEERIIKIVENLSASINRMILLLYVCIIILLPTTLLYLNTPKYGILTIEYLDPDTPIAMSQSAIIDELCPLIERDFFGYYFNYNYPWNGTNKHHKNLILTKDEWLKIKASKDKIKKVAKETKDREKRGNLEIIK